MSLAEFIEYVNRNKRNNCFVHFTAAENIPLISEHGILSTRTRMEWGVEAPFTGGNDWSRSADERSGMDHYVHLAFKKGHPMEYYAAKRFSKLIHLEIKADVLELPGVLVTADVSNKKGVEPLPLEKALQTLDLDILYNWHEWKDSGVQERLKVAQKYEILVPGRVPLNFIRNL